MASPIRLRYHQATFDLLSRKPIVSAAAAKVPARREQLDGVPYPASLREQRAAEQAARATQELRERNEIHRLLGEVWEANAGGVPPGDPQALGEALLRLWNDPELRQRLGQAGRRRARQHFEVRRMVADYERLYEGQRPRPADFF